MQKYKTVNIDAELHKKLKKHAIEVNLTVTDLVEDAVSLYFDPEVDSTGPIKKESDDLSSEFHPQPK